MRVCLIGANGYIGSCLSLSLAHFHLTKIESRQTSYDSNFIRGFKVIIYLGGISSRQMTLEQVPENTQEIFSIAQMMTRDQLLIYASTSALSEGSIDADEETPIKEELLGAYPLSMWQREKLIRSLSIRSVGLRFGSIIGISPKQRSDRLHIQMLKSALFTGRIHVQHPFSLRPILSMSDLVRAINSIIENEPKCSPGEIFNLASFNTTIQTVASEISLLTEARIVYKSSEKKVTGFSIVSRKFQKRFEFEFKSNQGQILKELIERKSELLRSWRNPVRETLPCFVCGNSELMEMIDLGDQPLANLFTSEKIQLPAYPLAMYRCLKCQHNQLNHVVPPQELFTDYIYVTGTTKTMDDYCESFCAQVGGDPGTVLDIACNDGTQLDKFKSRGWKTYGVDPARNLEPISTAKGHQVIVGFWGQPEITSTISKEVKHFDVIIAQNVFAHVPNPRAFLEACREVMSDQTHLYIQTSQAEIFKTGEYDTIYHEHLSFFTVRSMLELSKSCGLFLENVIKVPVHGISYLFTLRLSGDHLSKGVEDHLREEEEIYGEINPIVYRSHALEKTEIICSMLKRCHENGYTLVGFGAPAKGNTLLNFIRGKVPLPEYIVDDNPRKQGLFTPGTQIPVVAYSDLTKETRPVAILVLAWNFLDEIKSKVIEARKRQLTLLLVPFPTPTVLLLKGTVWEAMSSIQLQVSIPKVETLLITHFYNEEFLLPYWIMHHAPMFTHVVLIDYDSTDQSCEIIRRLAPSSWRVLKSRNRLFDAHQVDAEIRDVERSYPDSVWKLTLTVTEFVIWPKMKSELNSGIQAFKIYSHIICGDDTLPLDPELPLIQQRCRSGSGFDYGRFIHYNTNKAGDLYHIGRHGVSIPAQPASNAMLFKFHYSPWPEIIPRKLQIGNRQPPHDIAHRWGFQHQCTLEKLQEWKSDHEKNLGPDMFLKGIHSPLQSQILHEHLGLPWSSQI